MPINLEARPYEETTIEPYRGSSWDQPHIDQGRSDRVDRKKIIDKVIDQTYKSYHDFGIEVNELKKN